MEKTREELEREWCYKFDQAIQHPVLLFQSEIIAQLYQEVETAAVFSIEIGGLIICVKVLPGKRLIIKNSYKNNPVSQEFQLVNDCSLPQWITVKKNRLQRMIDELQEKLLAISEFEVTLMKSL